MPSDSGTEPVGWGTVSGLFGSDSSEGAADPPGPATPRRSSFGRRGSAPSASSASSFGARSSAGKRQARTGGRRDGARRSPFDDPFGPVVGSSADAPTADAVVRDVGEGPAQNDAAPRRTGRGGTKRSGAGRGGDGTTPHPGATEDPDVADGGAGKSDEEWASEARSVLLRQLALGPRSRHQLDQKLAGRDVPPAIASSLLDRFEEVQLIDDAEFARMWVRTRTAAKSLSRSSLRRELADKGIDPDLAEDALLQLSDEDEHEQAREVARRRLRSSADLSDRAVREKEVRRLVGVLARKGYSPGTAFSIVKDVVADERTED
ncbi:RecX family transcriptional regulator [Arthrobacter sp. B0490]|uniref:RecX family transcriptional regulator n=1 Tax=Arthrobacter sp. B0490 TaxID=2058891 RepID=UPI0021578899|nr:RecX family transcriptional regulator [Arthrobacter sp. B0490]